MALWLEKRNEQGVICSGKFSNGTVTIEENELTLSEAQRLVKSPSTLDDERWILRIK